jgi:membrane-bound serine protease (ClpP class)
VGDLLSLFDPILEPNLLYIILIGAAWLAVVAMFIPGTGYFEVAAVAGLLLGVGGAISQGANAIGLALLALSFGLYALVVLRLLLLAQAGDDLAPWRRTAVVLGVIAALIQAAGGLVLFVDVPGVSPWIVLILALVSLAVHRWMLTPAAAALRPPPQTGSEALFGARAEVRGAPPTPGQAAMIYLNGELWQAVADLPLAAGDRVEVIGREGMRLRVRKIE